MSNNKPLNNIDLETKLRKLRPKYSDRLKRAENRINELELNLRNIVAKHNELCQAVTKNLDIILMQYSFLMNFLMSKGVFKEEELNEFIRTEKERISRKNNPKANNPDVEIQRVVCEGNTG